MPSTKQHVSLSCITVGIGPGGATSMLAWVSLVDYRGRILHEYFVAPTSPVTDFRTSQTGITQAHLNPENAMPFATVQACVAEAINEKILIGHSLWKDLSVLGLRHPASATRDVALYQAFRNALREQNPGLRSLMWQFMSRQFSEDCVHPAEIARACIDLYRSACPAWEQTIEAGQWPCAIPPPKFARCYS